MSAEDSQWMTTEEAAAFLGVGKKAVYMAVYEGRLRKARRGRGKPTFDRADVEAYLARRWHPGRSDPYWVDLSEAAELLGIPGERVRDRARRNLLPTPVKHPSGRLLFRRQQIEVIAQAREGPLVVAPPPSADPDPGRKPESL
jgi:excisionase family DNA binding protein